MRRMLAIAALTIREVTRSRLVFILLGVLLAVIVSLGTSIKGDGTLMGRTTILLNYVLGSVFLVLAAVTLWVGCSAISQDIEEKQIHMVAVKPIHAVEVWAGRWIGLMAVNVVLLAVCGLITYAMVMADVRSDTADAEDVRSTRTQILVGRLRQKPEREISYDEVHREMERLLASGQLAPDLPHDEACRQAEQRLMAIRSTVAPGGVRAWRIAVPDHFRDDAPVSLRTRFSVSSRDREPVSGTWSVLDADGRERVSVPMENYLAGVHHLILPASALPRGQEVVIRFANGSADRSVTAVFDLHNSLELLISVSSFEGNLVRAMLVLACELGLLAALGLTAGVWFSFPVATFVSGGIVIIALMCHYFTYAMSPEQVEHLHHHHGHEHEHEEARPSWFVEQGEWLLNVVNVVVRPTTHAHPLGSLADGIDVSWRATARAAGMLVVVYAGLLGLAGGISLQRRELALPER